MMNAFNTKFTPLLACLFPILSLSYGEGYKSIPIVLLVCSLPLFFTASKTLFDRNVNLLILAFLYYFGIFVLSALLQGDSLSRIDGPSRFVFSIIIFIAVLRFPPKFSWISNSIFISAYVAGFSALVCIYVYGDIRAFLGTNNDFFMEGFMPIQSGNMAMTFGVMSLPIAIYFLRQRKLCIALLCSTGSAFGLAASYLSGTRGSWIFFPLAIGYLLYVNRDSLNCSKRTFGSLLILTLPSILLISGLNMTTELKSNLQRIEEVSIDFEQYTHNNVTLSNTEVGDAEGSVGVRLELWKDSFYTFLESPLLGVGYDQRLELRQKWKSDGLIHLPKRYDTTHSHSQYFEALSVRGIVGLIGLLSIFIAPLIIFRRVYRGANEQVKTIAQCGALSVIMMMGYCLTQAMFRHNSGAIFYPLMTVILVATCLRMVDKPDQGSMQTD